MTPLGNCGDGFDDGCTVFDRESGIEAIDTAEVFGLANIGADVGDGPFVILS